MQPPDTRWAWNDEAAIAYQVFGKGDGPDLLVSFGYMTNVELFWEHPLPAMFLRRLAATRRVILMDYRGHGCSERGSPYDVWPLETLMQDITAVLDAAGSQQAVLLGEQVAGNAACIFAATYPERTAGLVLYETATNYVWSEETPWEWTEEEFFKQPHMTNWATREYARDDVASYDPTVAGDRGYVEWWRRLQVGSHAPGYARAATSKYMWTDIRAIASTISVPVLVLCRRGTEIDWEPSARHLAQSIAGARLELLSGPDGSLWVGDTDDVLSAIDVFVDRVRVEQSELERVLATVLFTDIVGSTEKLAERGNAGWRDLVERHHRQVRALLERFRGAEVDTAGDGFFASFDGPARAIRCALAIVEEVRSLGIEVRAGVHTGECELIDGKVGGMAVNLGARVGAAARPSEVLVSQTVKDLVVGSGLVFEDRGEHELKGVDGSWRLYRALS